MAQKVINIYSRAISYTFILLMQMEKSAIDHFKLFFFFNQPGKQLTGANHLLMLSRCCPKYSRNNSWERYQEDSFFSQAVRWGGCCPSNSLICHESIQKVMGFQASLLELVKQEQGLSSFVLYGCHVLSQIQENKDFFHSCAEIFCS